MSITIGASEKQQQTKSYQHQWIDQQEEQAQRECPQNKQFDSRAQEWHVWKARRGYKDESPKPDAGTDCTERGRRAKGAPTTREGE